MKQMNTKIIAGLMAMIMISCTSCGNDDTIVLPIEKGTDRPMVKAIDASFIPELRKLNIETFDLSRVPKDFLDILSNLEFNTVRLRVWHSPSTEHSSLEEVKYFSDEIKAKGMKVWLTMHYSDTWADPAKQDMPSAWKNLPFEVLKDSVFQYTSKVMTEINPDYVQIGNEINYGFLWPEGNSSNLSAFKELIGEGVDAVRNANSKTKIMLHFAGHVDAIDFFREMNDIDYDIAALSYYPYWHGNNLDHFEFNVNLISSDLNKEIVVAETIYPFATLDGTDRFLVPGYPATPEGQSNFVKDVYQVVLDDPKGLGIGIWGGVIGAYKQPKPGTYNGTHWENQAVLNYDNVQLPILDMFK